MSDSWEGKKLLRLYFPLLCFFFKLKWLEDDHGTNIICVKCILASVDVWSWHLYYRELKHVCELQPESRTWTVLSMVSLLSCAAHSTIYWKVTESGASHPSHISVCWQIAPHLLSEVDLAVMSFILDKLFLLALMQKWKDDRPKVGFYFLAAVFFFIYINGVGVWINSISFQTSGLLLSSTHLLSFHPEKQFSSIVPLPPVGLCGQPSVGSP